MKRYKLSKTNSKSYFRNAADLIHKKNGLQAAGSVMRGGIRL